MDRCILALLMQKVLEPVPNETMMAPNRRISSVNLTFNLVQFHVNFIVQVSCFYVYASYCAFACEYIVF